MEYIYDATTHDAPEFEAGSVLFDFRWAGFSFSFSDSHHKFTAIGQAFERCQPCASLSCNYELVIEDCPDGLGYEMRTTCTEPKLPWVQNTRGDTHEPSSMGVGGTCFLCDLVAYMPADCAARKTRLKNKYVLYQDHCLVRWLFTCKWNSKTGWI